MKHLQVPPAVVTRIVDALREEQSGPALKVKAERSRLEGRLTAIRTRMDKAYSDKLDGKIPEDFWERKMSDWRTEEQQVRMAIQGLDGAESRDHALDAQRIFELANKAFSLSVSQDSVEQAELLRMLVSNYSVSDVSATLIDTKPVNLIFERARTEKWSGRLDSN